MTIKTIRNQIDEVDEEIVALLQKRWRLVADISKLKKLTTEEAGYRPYREQAIYNKLPDDKSVARDEYWSIWKEIMTTTVMRENPFHIATSPDFFARHGFLLAQEFGRRTKWRQDADPLQLLKTRAVGLAVVPITMVAEVVALKNNVQHDAKNNADNNAGDNIAVVNIFPSFLFDNKDDKKISNEDVSGLILAWQKMEEEATDSLAVVLADNGERFDIVDQEQINGRSIIGNVPRPPYWQE